MGERKIEEVMGNLGRKSRKSQENKKRSTGSEAKLREGKEEK